MYSLNQHHERMADGPKQSTQATTKSEPTRARDGRVNTNTKRIDMP